MNKKSTRNLSRKSLLRKEISTLRGHRQSLEKIGKQGGEENLLLTGGKRKEPPYGDLAVGKTWYRSTPPQKKKITAGEEYTLPNRLKRGNARQGRTRIGEESDIHLVTGE